MVSLFIKAHKPLLVLLSNKMEALTMQWTSALDGEIKSVLIIVLQRNKLI